MNDVRHTASPFRPEETTAWVYESFDRARGADVWTLTRRELWLILDATTIGRKPNLLDTPATIAAREKERRADVERRYRSAMSGEPCTLDGVPLRIRPLRAAT